MHSHRNEENTARLYLRRYTLLEHGMFADIDNGTPPEPQRDIEFSDRCRLQDKVHGMVWDITCKEKSINTINKT